MTMPTLYHCRDARSFRVLWMLEELGIAYRLENLPFPPRDKAPAFLADNPLGTVPLLVDGAVRMTESAAICHYLATTYGGGHLARRPGDAGYPAYLDALFFGEATLTFPQTLVLRYALFEPEARRQPQVAEDYRRWYLGRLTGLENLLERDGGHVAGAAFSAADISVGYALMLADMLRLDPGSPRISAYWDRLRARPAFLRAKAAQQAENGA
ncbi:MULTISPECIES: glutathione S-transferase family protein [Sphingobium]|jgi:glutathione S-transferase|nr:MULTISPECIES: glutathione S-transferase family protein [Sphingobium]MDV3481056.1 glutathione S-transferase family protein [Sphingobium yanoikuyae]